MRVLIIDDEQISLTLTADILESEGYEVYKATAVRPAIAILEGDNPIDLILLDIMMPKVDGLQLLRFLKSTLRFNKIPVILCTARNDVASVAKCMECGGDDYLVKPIEAKLLKDKVNNAIKNRIGSVLIVTEERVQLDILLRTIDREGFRCICCTDGEEAWSIVQTEKIAVVVADFDLPGISGYELLLRVKKKFPELPMLLIADSRNERSRERVIAAGADGYLVKPFKNTDVIRRIASMAK